MLCYNYRMTTIVSLGYTNYKIKTRMDHVFTVRKNRKSLILIKMYSASILKI